VKILRHVILAILVLLLLSAIAIGFGLGPVVYTAQVPPVDSKSPPFVMIQAVEAAWSPLPGAQVVLQEQSGKRLTHRAVTNREGFASFWLAPPDRNQTFSISVSMQGFRKAEMKDVRFGTCDGDCNYSRYVQLRLDVSGPLHTIR
jgi:hypothetical protein